MQVLIRPSEIRTAIREILRDPTDERVVAVAFVGSDALSFIQSSPRKMAIYCWPRAGGTNPDAIDELVRADAHVYFVKQLHAKVYWSRKGGALIGSANLTRNALGEKPLLEAAVRVPPGAFDIQTLIRSMNVLPDFATELNLLHEAHVRFLQRNPLPRDSTNSPKPLPSFRKWLSSGGIRKPWRLGWYDGYADPPRDALDALEKKSGSDKFITYLGASRSHDLKVGIFTLSFLVKEAAGLTKVRDLEWWVPEFRVRSQTKAWKDWPYIWFARRRIPVGTRPPFDASEKRFRRALAAAIRESGGLNWLYESTLKVGPVLLERLERQYDATGL